MRRVTQGILAGGIVAAAAGLFMRRTNRGNNMMNSALNSIINGMGRLGVFRLYGKSRMFRNMVRNR